MVTTHYERRLDQELQKTVDAMFSVPLGDSHRLAHVQGIRAGLLLAKTAFKEVAHANTDPDDL